MKRMKKLFALVMIAALLFGVIGVRSRESKAAGTYWVTGGYENSSLIFNGKKFKFAGLWGKGSSLDASVTSYYGNPPSFSATLKKGKHIKTGSIGSDGLLYDSSPQLDTGTNLVGITTHVKIKNNKVIRVIYSAM